MVSFNTPMARAFFDHNDRERQKARRLGPGSPRPEPIDTTTFTTKAGDGATSTDNDTISITYGTALTALRAGRTVVSGKRYRITWNMDGAGGQAMFGATLGGAQYRPALAGVVGANKFEFTAQSTPVYLSFQRNAAGTSTFSNLRIVEIPEVTWTDTDIITPATFTIFTTGASIDPETGVITIPATGTQMNARGSFVTEIGKLYRVRYLISTNTAFLTLGTTNGGSQLKIASMSELGQRYFEFTATTNPTWINFHRVTSGTTQISDIRLQAVDLPDQFSNEYTEEFN
jgi:hypothetical protein